MYDNLIHYLYILDRTGTMHRVAFKISPQNLDLTRSKKGSQKVKGNSDKTVHHKQRLMTTIVKSGSSQQPSTLNHRRKPFPHGTNVLLAPSKNELTTFDLVLVYASSLFVVGSPIWVPVFVSVLRVRGNGCGSIYIGRTNFFVLFILRITIDHLLPLFYEKKLLRSPKKSMPGL